MLPLSYGNMDALFRHALEANEDGFVALSRPVVVGSGRHDFGEASLGHHALQDAQARGSRRCVHVPFRGRGRRRARMRAARAAAPGRFLARGSAENVQQRRVGESRRDHFVKRFVLGVREEVLLGERSAEPQKKERADQTYPNDLADALETLLHCDATRGCFHVDHLAQHFDDIAISAHKLERFFFAEFFQALFHIDGRL